MKPTCLQRTWLVLSLAIIFIVLTPASLAADLPADAIEKIEAALPAKATAVASRPRTVLIF